MDLDTSVLDRILDEISFLHNNSNNNDGNDISQLILHLICFSHIALFFFSFSNTNYITNVLLMTCLY